MSSGNNLSASEHGDYHGRTRPPNVWSVWVQGLAIRSPSLMDALLGFSAFHLRSQNPSDQVMARASHSHMVRAISEHAKVLRGGVNADNAQVLFATSTFIAFHAFAGQRFLHGSEKPLLPLHWFYAYQVRESRVTEDDVCRLTCLQHQGIKTILMAGWRWIRDSEIKGIIIFPRRTRESFREGQDALPFQFLLDDLDLPNTDHETLDAYQMTVAYLNELTLSTASSHKAFRFLGIAPPHFVNLLAAKDPRALVIMGYFFMVVKRLGEVWWMQGTVDREFTQLMTFLPR